MLGEWYVSSYSAPLPNVEPPSNGNDLEVQGIPVLMEVETITEDVMALIEELCSSSLVDSVGMPAVYY